jgi:ribonuclease D
MLPLPQKRTKNVGSHVANVNKIIDTAQLFASARCGFNNVGIGGHPIAFLGLIIAQSPAASSWRILGFHLCHRSERNRPSMSENQGKPDNKYRPYSPTKFRAAAHESAHAEMPAADHPRVNHPLVNHDPPQFIDTQDQLLDLIEHLRSAGRFAYDSEFIGELTYIPKLCLIQVASADRVALVDPLVGLDLDPYWQLLCDPSVEKIVHAGQQDVEPVFRNAGCPAANVFDTQICAGFVGLAYPVALSKLVYEVVGAKLGKGLTFTHWDQRPLSAMQLRYAADDVRYLVALRDDLGKRLDQTGHTQWAKQECDALCEPTQYTFDPENYFKRIRGGGSLQPRNQAVLKELTIWRDGCARAHDVPARAFLKDEILLDLARQPVKAVEKLERVRGLPRPVEQAHGAEIVAATARGLATPSENLPQVNNIEPTPQQRFRADALWAAMQCLCAGRSIDPALVTSRQEIGELYRVLSSEGKPGETGLLTGWRREAVGQALLDLVAGKARLGISWSDTLRTELQ